MRLPSFLGTSRKPVARNRSLSIGTSLYYPVPLCPTARQRYLHRDLAACRRRPSPMLSGFSRPCCRRACVNAPVWMHCTYGVRVIAWFLRLHVALLGSLLCTYGVRVLVYCACAACAACMYGAPYHHRHHHRRRALVIAPRLSAGGRCPVALRRPLPEARQGPRGWYTRRCTALSGVFRRDVAQVSRHASPLTRLLTPAHACRLVRRGLTAVEQPLRMLDACHCGWEQLQPQEPSSRHTAMTRPRGESMRHASPVGIGGVRSRGSRTSHCHPFTNSDRRPAVSYPWRSGLCRVRAQTPQAPQPRSGTWFA